MVATSSVLTSLVAFGASVMAASLPPCNKTALIIVDVQNDFALPTGNLSVSGGEAIIPVINEVRHRGNFDMVVLTQDWHPVGHVSFYSRWANDPKAKMFQPYTLPSSGDGPVWPPNTEQVLWPDHCVQNGNGAEFHKDLHVSAKKDIFIKKGANPNLDSYSGLLENDHKTETALPKMLKDAGIQHVVVVGLAEDYCVGSTALDAKTVYGYDVTVLSDATAAVAPGSKKAMEGMFQKHGVTLQTSADFFKAQDARKCRFNSKSC
ncbi:hypothetical protein SPRG_17012 [Saprolegnia parasitica CBS 223.65]|uniref:nicotinamidase n=1 Tax=Saprolegnia parasitica (strain CBS 223.65) TaxID=695850 RepID=A0A067BHB4_SAPPC|nr:hypothetical protein SPRG_17012 [Saprolegnia parasitica CBS 223.65]KDO17568.1 hypothetical protein SPRG_17012 [Saprolegnia parasitica CBS 223.65]|eukprot:XP_012211725.1 hypothetical protein SPRG_17012 [Saprolegnia parasitica CBS 223.65]